MPIPRVTKIKMNPFKLSLPVNNVRSKNILSLKISTIKYNEALDNIINLAKEKVPSYVCFANVHMAIEAYDKPSFAQKVNNANLVLPDGMPIVKSIKKFYKLPQDRIAGMDVFPDLLAKCASSGVSIFLFGSTNEVLEAIKARINQEFPAIKIAGLCSPAFHKPINDIRYVDEIKKSNAEIVFVALGCPKQETWMAENSVHIEGVLLGIGAAFPIYANVQKMAPAILRNNSLEWLYRLIQEPRRLFLRYFYTNLKFMILIIKQFLSLKL